MDAGQSKGVALTATGGPSEPALTQTPSACTSQLPSFKGPSGSCPRDLLEEAGGQLGQGDREGWVQAWETRSGQRQMGAWRKGDRLGQGTHRPGMLLQKLWMSARVRYSSKSPEATSRVILGLSSSISTHASSATCSGWRSQTASNKETEAPSQPAGGFSPLPLLTRRSSCRKVRVKKSISTML